MIKQLLNTAITAAIESGKTILEIYHTSEFDVEIKGDNSPLTVADTASHKVIMNYLKKTKIPVLSEEGKEIPYKKRKDWNHLWIVDPIDGTKEFIKRNGEFTVNIALIENQKPLIGVIFVPISGILYFSSIGFGAFKAKIDFNNYNIDRILDKSQKLPLHREDKTFTMVTSRSHISPETETYVEEMKVKHGAVNLISKGSSLKLCMVAEGKADCYPRFAPTMEWDTAAGQAICEYAGFDTIDTFNSKKIVYNKENLRNNSFICKKKHNN